MVVASRVVGLGFGRVVVGSFVVIERLVVGSGGCSVVGCGLGGSVLGGGGGGLCVVGATVVVVFVVVSRGVVGAGGVVGADDEETVGKNKEIFISLTGLILFKFLQSFNGK